MPCLACARAIFCSVVSGRFMGALGHCPMLNRLLKLLRGGVLAIVNVCECEDKGQDIEDFNFFFYSEKSALVYPSGIRTSVAWNLARQWMNV